MWKTTKQLISLHRVISVHHLPVNSVDELLGLPVDVEPCVPMPVVFVRPPHPPLPRLHFCLVAPIHRQRLLPWPTVPIGFLARLPLPRFMPPPLPPPAAKKSEHSSASHLSALLCSAPRIRRLAYCNNRSSGYL